MEIDVRMTSQHQDWLEICLQALPDGNRVYSPVHLRPNYILFSKHRLGRNKYNSTRGLFSVSGIPYCSQYASKHSVATLQQELHHFGMSDRSVENRSLLHTFNCDVSTSLKQQLNGFYSSISGSFEQGSTACLVRRVHRSTLCNKLHMYSCICDYFETNVVYLWLTGRQTNTKNTRNLIS